MSNDVKYGLKKVSTCEETFLTIYSNVITDDLLDTIDNVFTNCVCFHCNYNNHILHFNCSIEKWNSFIANKTHIAFYGPLTDKYIKFSAQHLQNAKKLQFLHIGASSYDMFDGDNLDELSNFRLVINGFGLVQQSATMKEWIERNNHRVCFMC